MPRKSKNTVTNIVNVVNEPEYLGIPENEDDWLKYEGRCMIFAGVNLEQCVF